MFKISKTKRGSILPGLLEAFEFKISKTKSGEAELPVPVLIKFDSSK